MVTMLNADLVLIGTGKNGKGENMAYNLQIVDEKQGISINAKYSNMSNYKRPEIEAKEPNGKVVKERSTYQGTVLGPGSTQRQWVDDDGNVYAKSELTFFYEGEPVEENTQTKVFHVEQYEPLPKYTDFYIIDKYYEVVPSNNGMKKDHDRDIAIRSNLSSMYKLWQYLTENDVVARGEFCTSSRGFVASDGYIRAISIEGKWGLEIGVFKEEKIFEHLNEGQAAAVTGAKKRLKMV
jgi:hypothetical protein